MKTIINKYKEKICKLPSNINKEDILNDNFFLKEEKNLKVYYAPHNEYINKEAKIIIVGICPGWTQTKLAYERVKEDFNNEVNQLDIIKNCKSVARFAGSMRKNLIDMLNELKLNKVLSIDSCEELFQDNELLHTTSLIPYPVFINGKNYTGHTPSIIDSPLLMNYVEKHFYKELNQMKNKYLIIPLGKSVEEVLELMINDDIIQKENCLFGFPHPSGANGHRKEYFEMNKDMLIKKIKEFGSHLK